MWYILFFNSYITHSHHSHEVHQRGWGLNESVSAIIPSSFVSSQAPYAHIIMKNINDVRCTWTYKSASQICAMCGWMDGWSGSWHTSDGAAPRDMGRPRYRKANDWTARLKTWFGKVFAKIDKSRHNILLLEVCLYIIFNSLLLLNPILAIF